MRLRQIRLAGFKTFVDPAVIDLPTNRTALVGPNGAGKSNIIDAVRWVIGERSAKSLRGQILEDVIFKGSDSRAPADLASIELIFDEVVGQVGRLREGGDELSVRREITRDGQSVYRLNGTRCRRRDVLDVFLDTGFTSQGYAIIEQGQISELVQAKPEELRGYLEEAAGISRYKERRRETELSMEQAKLNLERANDLRHEREERIGNLKRQARRAKRYSELAKRGRELEACEAFTRKDQADVELAKLESEVLEVEDKVSKSETRRSAQESRRDALYAERDAANGRLNKINGEYFDAGAEISRAESAINSLKQALEQHTQDLSAASSERDSVVDQISDSKERLGEVKISIQKHAMTTEHETSQRQQDRDALEQSEALLRTQRAELDSVTTEASRLNQELALLQADLDSARERIADGESRLGQLEIDLEAEDASRLPALGQAVQEAERAYGRLFELKEQTFGKRSDLRGRLAPLEAEVESKRHEEQRLQRELSAILALVGEAGETDAQAIDEWLKTRNSKHLPRLGVAVNVGRGWEAAARTLLSGKTAGVLAPSLSSLAAHLEGLAAGELLIIEHGSRQAHGSSPLKAVLGRDFGSIFSGIRLEEKTAEALAQRGELAEGESILCRDGTWVGRDWIRVNRRHLPESAFDVAPDVEQLKHQCGLATRAVEESQRNLANLRELLERTQTELDEIEQNLDKAQSRRGQATAQRQVEQARLSEAEARREESKAARGRLQERVEALNRHLRARELEGESLRERCEEQQLTKSRIANLFLTSERQRDALREAALTSETRYQNARVEHERLIVAERSLCDSLPQVEHRFQALEKRIAQINQRIEEANAGRPRLESEREHWLRQRLEIERKLQTAREKLEQIEEKIRAEVNRLRDTEAELETLRELRENSRVAAGEVRAQVAELASRIERLGVGELDIKDLRASLEGHSADEIEGKRLEVERSIARIGDVNLAASEDLAEEQGRHDELVAQIEDLEQSLETLSSALNKIDEEMVQRFRGTFELANEGLADLFPKLFGGGSARLEMHGASLLETGITFMANPPGKRNTSVTLLSGGEKAMSAIALVFSLFRLNPSPVCLLDEVDAPLDDENVGRFVDLIRDMSGEVQFVIITHNKLTMEMADHLLGVTMREPGVSRLVSVDVNQAASLAAS